MTTYYLSGQNFSPFADAAELCCYGVVKIILRDPTDAEKLIMRPILEDAYGTVRPMLARAYGRAVAAAYGLDECEVEVGVVCPEVKSLFLPQANFVNLKRAHGVGVLESFALKRAKEGGEETDLFIEGIAKNLQSPKVSQGPEGSASLERYVPNPGCRYAITIKPEGGKIGATLANLLFFDESAFGSLVQ